MHSFSFTSDPHKLFPFNIEHNSPYFNLVTYRCVVCDFIDFQWLPLASASTVDSCLSCVSVDKCNTTNISLFYESREHNSCDIEEWNFTCHINADVNVLITAIKQHVGGHMFARQSLCPGFCSLFIYLF